MPTTPEDQPSHRELLLARVDHAEQAAQEARRVLDGAHAALVDAKARGLSPRKREPAFLALKDAGDTLRAARRAMTAERIAVMAHFAWQRIVPLLAESADESRATDDLRGAARDAASRMTRAIVAYLDAQALVHVMYRLCRIASDEDDLAASIATWQPVVGNREKAYAGVVIARVEFDAAHETLLASGGDSLLGDPQIIADLTATMPVPTPDEEERERERSDLASMWPNANEHAEVEQATRDVEWAIVWLARACTDSPAKPTAHLLRLWAEIAERTLPLGMADRLLQLAEQSTQAEVDELMRSVQGMAEHDPD